MSYFLTGTGATANGAVFAYLQSRTSNIQPTGGAYPAPDATTVADANGNWTIPNVTSAAYFICVGQSTWQAQTPSISPVLLTSSAATTSAVGDSAAAGSGTTAALTDHKHGREAFGAVTVQTTVGASSANGSAVTVSHSDHAHGTPAAPVAPVHITGNSTLGALNLDSGDQTGTVCQLAFNYGGTDPSYPHYISSLHANGTPVGNQLKFWTSDGTPAGGFPAHAVLGLTLENGHHAMAQSATAVATAGNGTIATAGPETSRVNPAGNVTGIILAAGTVGGQRVTVVNESSFTLTFAASGTSNVADGTSDAIAALTARSFVWDSGTSLWYRLA